MFRDMPDLLAMMRKKLGESTPAQGLIAGDILESGKWLERLTEDRRIELYPAWTPDGRGVVYTLLGDPGDAYSSKLMVRYVENGTVVRLKEDPGRILRNVSLAVDGSLLAYYTAAARKTDEPVTLTVGQINYQQGVIAEIKTKWSGQVRLFEEVEADGQARPQWTVDGSLLFLNERRGKRNVVYQVNHDAFQRQVEPVMTQYTIGADTGVEYNIAGFDLAPESNEIFIVAQKGETFGLFGPPIPRPDDLQPVPMAFGAYATFLQYSGDASSLPGLGIAFFVRYPLGASLSVMGMLGQGYLRGESSDANNFVRTFTSSFVTISLVANYRLASAGPVEFFLNGGAGVASLNSANSATKGIKVLVPLGASVDIRFFPLLSISVIGEMTLTNGDLDGLRRTASSDKYMNIGIGLSRTLE
jgi:hypothetical protein